MWAAFVKLYMPSELFLHCFLWENTQWPWWGEITSNGGYHFSTKDKKVDQMESYNVPFCQVESMRYGYGTYEARYKADIKCKSKNREESDFFFGQLDSVIH